jgi:CBS domain containing-hemolysin-like protein
VLKKAYFIPETKKINVLLKEFQRKKIHMSVVVDEYGGFSGIVTMEDILEEIVGEIQDEYDDEEEDIIELGSGSFNCDARCDLEELNSRLKINLSTESVDTLGGFVYNLFGEIPKINQAASFENVNFKVLAMEKNTIERILVKVDYSTSEGDNGYNTD